jgi:hypothetical protein
MRRPVTTSALCTWFAAAAFTSSCVSVGRRSARGDGCRLRAADTLFVDGAPLYRECAVDVAATNVTRAGGPLARPPGPPRDGCYVVELQFVVDTTGVPEQRSARIIRTNDQGYADAVVATLPDWRYEPAQIKHHRVRQIVTEREMMSLAVGPSAAANMALRSPATGAPAC